ncbi:unnamed protein product, partial [Amoebophrya sp. A25]
EIEPVTTAFKLSSIGKDSFWYASQTATGAAHFREKWLAEAFDTLRREGWVLTTALRAKNIYKPDGPLGDGHFDKKTGDWVMDVDYENPTNGVQCLPQDASSLIDVPPGWKPS